MGQTFGGQTGYIALGFRRNFRKRHLFFEIWRSKLTFVICFEIGIFEKVTSTCEKVTSTCEKVTSIRANDHFRNSLIFRILFERYASIFKFSNLETSKIEIRPSKFELRTLQFQASNFEIRASNFEIRASNFEIRTSNFEIRTSKHDILGDNPSLLEACQLRAMEMFFATPIRPHHCSPGLTI